MDRLLCFSPHLWIKTACVNLGVRFWLDWLYKTTSHNISLASLEIATWLMLALNLLRGPEYHSSSLSLPIAASTGVRQHAQCRRTSSYWSEDEDQKLKMFSQDLTAEEQKGMETVAF